MLSQEIIFPDKKNTHTTFDGCVFVGVYGKIWKYRSKKGSGVEKKRTAIPGRIAVKVLCCFLLTFDGFRSVRFFVPGILSPCGDRTTARYVYPRS